jgi:hypothetical protein
MNKMTIRELLAFMGCKGPLTLGPRLQYLVKKVSRERPIAPYLAQWRSPLGLTMVIPPQL